MREPSAHWQQLVARLRKGSAMNYVWPIALAALVVAFCMRGSRSSSGVAWPAAVNGD